MNDTEKKLSIRERDSSSENIALKKTEISSIEGGQSNQGKDVISNKPEGKLL